MHQVVDTPYRRTACHSPVGAMFLPFAPPESEW